MKTTRKYQVQELVDDARVLTPGENFHPKNGNRAKYIADRLQMLLGLTPTQSTKLKYKNSKGEVKNYRYEDCKYDLNQGYLQLATRKSDEGRAAVNVAEWLTPKTGSLTEAVTRKIHLINQETEGNGAKKHKSRVHRRDIDGGQTAGDLLNWSGSKSNCNADQPILRDQGQVLTRDERGLIVKAEHLGVITGVDIALSSSDGTEAYYALVNDEVNSLVYNPSSGICECVNLVNPEEDVPQTIAKVFRHPERKKWLSAIEKEYMNLISKGTWRVALLPKGRRLLGCRLVLKRKVDKNGDISSYKARCVIQGHTQQEGVDYGRLFQPVAALSTLRNQCCFALHRKQDLKSFDFEQAFVQTLPDRDVFIR